MHPPTAVPTQIAHAHELVRRLGEPLLGGNHASVLADTEAARPALLAVLDQARDHVNLDASLLLIPALQDDLLIALAALCRQGVRVRLLVTPAHRAPDAVLLNLCQLGATVQRRASSTGLAGWMERRLRPMQRQLAVVDGRTAWLGPGLHPQRSVVQGPHVCVRGPIVQRLQRLLLGTGADATARPTPSQARHFPPIALSGRQRMGVSQDTQHACPLLGALDTARFNIFIAMSHRAPSQRLVQAIAAAARRGVSVSVLLQAADPAPGRWRATCIGLMNAGAWLYQGDPAHALPPHCTVDGVWSSVAIDEGSGWHSGAATGVPRLIVLDAAFASELDDVCQTAMARALLLDGRSLATPSRLQRWWRPSVAVPDAPAPADRALTSVHGSVEGPGLSP